MITRWALVLSTFAGCSLAVSCSQPESTESRKVPTDESAADTSPDPRPLDVGALKKRLDAGEDVFLLDVREPHELEEIGTIEGYVNIPMDQFEARLSEISKGRPVVLY